MSQDHLHIAINGPVFRVTLQRPEKHNALSRALLTDIGNAFEIHRERTDLKLAVLTGAGERFFAAGGDLRDLESVRTLNEAQEMADRAKGALNAIRHFPVPVVAALNGDAMGGGAELAMACDFRVAASHARIGFVQGRLNITSAWGGGVDLIRRIGPDRALGVLCRAQLLDGRQALELGMIDEIAPENGFNHAVEEFVSPFLRQSVQVLRGFKALIDGSRKGLPRHVLDRMETQVFAPTWVHEDHWNAAARILSGENSND